MRATYRILGHTIAGLVAVQAAAIAMWAFGMFHWLREGDDNTVTPQLADDFLEGVTGSAGMFIHSIGSVVIAVLAIVLLIVSFFAKIPSGVKWAAFVFLAVLFQWVIAIASFSIPGLAFLHGANALLVAWLGWRAAKQASVVSPTAPTPEAAVAR